MLQHICSYINSVLSTRKYDEQNAFEQNVVANLVSDLFCYIISIQIMFLLQDSMYFF